MLKFVKGSYKGSINVFPSQDKMYDAGSLHATETFDPEVGPREFKTHDEYTDGYYDCWNLMFEAYQDLLSERLEENA